MDTLPASARHLRQQLRDQTREHGVLQHLQRAALALADESKAAQGLDVALRHAMTLLPADDGVVLLAQHGELQVLAAQGSVLPVGARLLAGGMLGRMLLPEATASLREHLESRLRVGQRPEVALELLLPLRLAGKPLGLVALLRERTGPAVDDTAMQALTLLGGLLAGALALQVAAVPRSRPTRRANDALLNRLTAREQQVLALLPRGLSNGEIGAALGIATGTAKVHVERILHKLGVTDRTQAAVRAVEWGMTP